MTPLQILAISALTGMYLAPIAFVSARYGYLAGITLGLIQASLGVLVLSLFWDSTIMMNQASFEDLKQCTLLNN